MKSLIYMSLARVMAHMPMLSVHKLNYSEMGRAITLTPSQIISNESDIHGRPNDVIAYKDEEGNIFHLKLRTMFKHHECLDDEFFYREGDECIFLPLQIVDVEDRLMDGELVYTLDSYYNPEEIFDYVAQMTDSVSLDQAARIVGKLKDEIYTKKNVKFKVVRD